MVEQSLAGVMTIAWLSPISALAQFPESKLLLTVMVGPSLLKFRENVFLGEKALTYIVLFIKTVYVIIYLFPHNTSRPITSLLLFDSNPPGTV